MAASPCTCASPGICADGGAARATSGREGGGGEGAEGCEGATRIDADLESGSGGGEWRGGVVVGEGGDERGGRREPLG